MKTCSKCKIEKDLVEFNYDKSRKDNLQFNCKSCNKQYHLDNKERISERSKQYRLNNKEKISESKKKYYLNNKKIILQYRKQYYLENKNIIRKYQNKWEKNRKQTCPLFKLRRNIRNRISESIKNKGYYKKSNTNKILGCDFETFKAHLEKQFVKGMNWNNYGKWHLDHIYPVSLARDEAHLIELNHYTNFQPLWAFDNMSKGNKILEKQLFLL